MRVEGALQPAKQERVVPAAVASALILALTAGGASPPVTTVLDVPIFGDLQWEQIK